METFEIKFESGEAPRQIVYSGRGRGRGRGRQLDIIDMEQISGMLTPPPSRNPSPDGGMTPPEVLTPPPSPVFARRTRAQTRRIGVPEHVVNELAEALGQVNIKGNSVATLNQAASSKASGSKRRRSKSANGKGKRARSTSTSRRNKKQAQGSKRTRSTTPKRTIAKRKK